MAKENGEDRMRAGSRALSIFTYALNTRILRGHAEGPLRSSELTGTIGWAPETSLRKAVSNLRRLGALARSQAPSGSKGLTTELTEAGQGLLLVAGCLERWLTRAPGGPIALDGAAAAGVIRALSAGWDSTLIRALAERSLTLAELDAEIEGTAYPSLERRLNKLRATNLLIPAEGRGRTKPYGASEWLRHAIAPLTAACGWERRHLDGEAASISPTEVEAAFLLALPLVELPGDSEGACSLAVAISPAASGSEPLVAGVTVAVSEGRVASCSASTGASPRSWALGTSEAWLGAVIDADAGVLRLHGADPALARLLVSGLHQTLFSPPTGAKVRALGSTPLRFAGKSPRVEKPRRSFVSQSDK